MFYLSVNVILLVFQYNKRGRAGGKTRPKRFSRKFQPTELQPLVKKCFVPFAGALVSGMLTLDLSIKNRKADVDVCNGSHLTMRCIYRIG
jgi:hypothetical protein